MERNIESLRDLRDVIRKLICVLWEFYQEREGYRCKKDGVLGVVVYFGIQDLGGYGRKIMDVS